MKESHGDYAAWWGSYDVPYTQSLSFRVGPFAFSVQRERHEWRIATTRGTDPLDSSLVIAHESAEDALSGLPEPTNLIRVGVREAVGSLVLSPVLADRSVVSRPDHPFVIPPKEEATLFVSTPLWLTVKTSSGIRLLEVALWRPSDTWFGPNTREGELCYASTTACRLSLSEIPRRPHRAITTVRIKNRACTPLSLERLKLPVLHLSLFMSSQGDIFTQDLQIERLPDEDLSPAVLGRGAPIAAPTATVLSGPREPPPSNMVIRAFSSLFG